MKKVIVIGGGAAGMMAAYHAAAGGASVTLLEKNEKLGKKIYITGKGRCNVTNNCDADTFFSNVVSNPKYLFSSYYGFDSDCAMQFFEDAGIALKTERGNRVFPVSDHASDIIKGLETSLKRVHVKVRLKTKVQELLIDDTCVKGVRLIDGSVLQADSVIVATGGFSYQSTGSTGDGYKFAVNCGHTIKELRPSLVPIETQEEWVFDLMGVSLRNVNVRIKDGKKTLYDSFGEMLFTHFGISGPLILTASCYIGKKLKEKPLKLELDLKPAMNEEQLDKRLLRDFSENQNRQFKNAVKDLFPAKLTPIMIRLSGIPEDTPVHQITKEQRMSFVKLMKSIPITLTGLRDYNEAIITQGGVATKEVDPSTMESKKISGLYFAGEVLDLDAVTGGFNLQIAWSTGTAAGRAAAGE